MEENNKSQEKIIKGYVRYLKLERGLSANTLEAYQRDLEKLLVFIKREDKHVLDVELTDLQTFAAGLHDIGIGPRSQCRILSGVRSFYHFLMVDGYRDDDPTELLESPTLGEHLPEVLSTAEVDQLEQSIDLSKWEGHRNRAIIEVLFSCGLRVRAGQPETVEPLSGRAVCAHQRQGLEGAVGAHLAAGHQGAGLLVQ